MSERAYPIRPAPDDDPRFTTGLLHDVRNVLAAHGYPPITSGPDLVELNLALYRFLYGGAS
jgi:hypothetical protein